ncbi:MAG: hypothetical protein A07HN63_01399, partial [uncultured archaeon A07HN63]
IMDKDIESEIRQAWKSVNMLHKRLFEVGMKERISEELLGNEF